MDFGKSLCVLCRQPLAGQETLLATPSDCPTHYFHFDCLTKRASEKRTCPIDRVPFDNIVFADVEEAESELKIKGDNRGENEKKDEVKDEKEEERNRGEGASALQENTNDLPPSATMPISREETCDSGKKDLRRQTTGQKINDALSMPPGGLPVDNDIGTIECQICKNRNKREMASPDCCVHWFHRNCLENYLRAHSVCPVRGCHREVSTYICSSGEGRGIGMTVECEYRIMASAPDGFLCGICAEAQIGRHRAVARPCGHIFHRHCLTDFVRRNKKCPTCDHPTKLVTGCTPGDLVDMHFD